MRTRRGCVCAWAHETYSATSIASLSERVEELEGELDVERKKQQLTAQGNIQQQIENAELGDRTVGSAPSGLHRPTKARLGCPQSTHRRSRSWNYASRRWKRTIGFTHPCTGEQMGVIAHDDAMKQRTKTMEKLQQGPNLHRCIDAWFVNKSAH